MPDFDFGEFLRQKRIQDAVNAHDPNYNPDDAAHWIASAQAIHQPQNMNLNAEPEFPDAAQSVPQNSGPVMPQIGPEETKYREMLPQQPKLADYHPSRLRSILASIAGGVAGINDPTGGARAQALNQAIRYGPYRQQLEQFNQGLGIQKTAAEQEIGDVSRAAVQAHLGAQTKAEVAREGANLERQKTEQHRQKEYIPEDEAAAIRLEHAKHPGTSAGTEGPYDIELTDGRTIKGAVWHKDSGIFSTKDENFDSSIVKSYTKGAAKEPGSEPLLPVQGPRGDVTYVPRSQAVGQKAPKSNDELMAVQALGARQDEQNRNRIDRSYQFHAKELDNIAKPLSETASRLSRLEDTINQNSPQADALVAPELLTIMAGGQGSGMRMNEAEIARIVGGRSKWESLKAAANKWSLDPKAALSITPEQRQEIRALAKTVRDKVDAKNAILNQASQELLGANDENSHKRALLTAKQRLSAVDSPQESSDTVEYKGRQIPKTIKKDGVTLTFDPKTQHYTGKR